MRLDLAVIAVGGTSLAMGALTGCETTECNDSPSATPSVLVLDAATQEPICTAQVALVDGDFMAKQEGARDPEECEGVYAGFPRRVGTYAVTVEAPGYALAQNTMRVTEDDCGKLVIEPDGERNGLPGRGNTVTIGLVRDMP